LDESHVTSSATGKIKDQQATNSNFPPKLVTKQIGRICPWPSHTWYAKLVSNSAYKKFKERVGIDQEGQASLVQPSSRIKV
jgi:hypothetical protein